MSRKRFSQSLPFDVGVYGSYGLGATSGIIPATPLSNKEVFQFRWNPSAAALRAIIRRIRVSAAVSTTYFAAGVPLELALSKCTAWSVAGTLGTAITPAAFGKKWNDFASTSLADGDARIAGTDANGLGAGTKTIETNAIASVISGAPITSSLSGQIFAPQDLFNADVAGSGWPLVLEQTEGFIIRATAPATGTWRLSVNVEWEEALDYPFNG